jgi:hypothetical protein
LQELSLARSPSLQGAKALAGLCAAALPALRRLDLSRNRLRPAALRAVAAAPWCAALAELDVRNFDLWFYSERDVDAIVAALNAPPLAAMAAGGRLREDFDEEPMSDDSCECDCGACFGEFDDCDCDECAYADMWDYGCGCEACGC